VSARALVAPGQRVRVSHCQALSPQIDGRRSAADISGHWGLGFPLCAAILVPGQRGDWRCTVWRGNAVLMTGAQKV
jgi:hypothetical protein